MANQSSNLNTRNDVEELKTLLSTLKNVLAEIENVKKSIDGLNSVRLSFKDAILNINKFNEKISDLDKNLSSFDKLQAKYTETEQKISTLTVKMGGDMLNLIKIIKEFKTESKNLGNISLKGGLRGGSGSNKGGGGSSEGLDSELNEKAVKTLNQYIDELERTLELKNKITFATSEDLKALQELIIAAKELRTTQGGDADASGLQKVATPEQIDAKASKDVIASEEKLLAAYQEQNEEIQRNKVLTADRNKELRQAATAELNASKTANENYMAITEEGKAAEANRQTLAFRNKVLQETVKYELILQDAIKRRSAAEQELASNTNLSKEQQTALKNEIKDLGEVIKYTEANLKSLSSSQGMAGHSTRKFNAAQWNTIQVIRELPNFAISARVGLMSLSNNLPMLADSLLRTGRAAAFFQRNMIAINIAVVGFTVLLMQLPKIIEWIRNIGLGKLGRSIREVSKDLEEGKSKIKEYGSKVLDIMGKLDAAMALGGDNTEVLKEYNKELGSIFGVASNATEAMKNLTDKTEAYFATIIIGQIKHKLFEKNMKEYGDDLIDNLTESLGKSMGILDKYDRAIRGKLTRWEKKMMDFTSPDRASKIYKAANVLGQLAEENNVNLDEIIIQNEKGSYSYRDLFDQIKSGTITAEDYDLLLKKLRVSIAENTVENMRNSKSWGDFYSATENSNFALEHMIKLLKDMYNLGDGGGGSNKHMKSIRQISASFREVNIALKEYDETIATSNRKLQSLRKIMDDSGVTGELNDMEERIDAWEEYYRIREDMGKKTHQTAIKNENEEYRVSVANIEKSNRANKVRWNKVKANYNEAKKLYEKAQAELTGDDLVNYTESFEEATKAYNTAKVEMWGGVDEDGERVLGAFKTNRQSLENLEKNHINNLKKIDDDFLQWAANDFYNKLRDYNEINQRSINDFTYEEKVKLNNRLVELEQQLARDLYKINTYSYSAIASTALEAITNQKTATTSLVADLEIINKEYDTKRSKIESEIRANDLLIAKEEEFIEKLKEKQKAGIFSSEQIAAADEEMAEKMKASNENLIAETEAATKKSSQKIVKLKREQAGKEIEITQSQVEKEQKIREKLYDSIKDQSKKLIEAVVSLIDALVENAIQRERNLLSSWEEEETNRVDSQLKSQVISEEQAQAQKEAIAWEVRKREHEIAIKEDKYNKERALFDIGLASAVGIMNAWSASMKLGTAGVAIASILTALILATAVAQGAAVLSKPAPTFAEGVIDYNPDDYTPIFGKGKALAGEQGAEMKIGRGGDVSLITRPTIIDMNRGDSIIPNSDIAMAMMLLGLSGQGSFSDKEIVSQQKETNTLLRKIAAGKNEFKYRNYNHFWN